MRIAFTHNLKLSNSEEEAEFDTPKTIAMISEGLRERGFEVEPVEVSGPASRVVARLEALNPDLIFNTAEGTRGRFREGFYPALFERLGFPYTGSDAYVCGITLDKQLTKMILEKEGIPVPRGRVIQNITQLETLDFRYPLFIKPNFEGSSMGILSDSVVENEQELHSRVSERLARYPTGVLVEEFIVGLDVVVPFLEKASPETGGVLEPALYRYNVDVVGDRKYKFFDFDMKNLGYGAVNVEVPAQITTPQRTRAMELTRRVMQILGIRDLARIDFRLGPDGEFYFLEVNALPSLEPGASMYRCGALVGLDTPGKVLETVIKSAAERAGLAQGKHRRPSKRTVYKVGLIFNLRRLGPSANTGSDKEIEYDTRETIDAVREAIESHGHEIVELEATSELPTLIHASGVDVVFNMSEGLKGRHREAQVPGLLELLEIPYTGTDPTGLSIALDKGIAKRLVSDAGYLTPTSVVMTTGREKIPPKLQFPAIVKPVAEGSSMGIIPRSVVFDEQELRKVVKTVIETYRQAALVETYLSGREFTIALIGERRPRVLPPMEIIFTDKNEKHPIYTFSRKIQGEGIRYQCPAKVTLALETELGRVAKGVFSVLGCRDMARIDVRLDANGKVNFLECNPLPGLKPKFSDFCLIADAAGIDHRTLIGELMAPALRRLREQKRERMLSGRLPLPGRICHGAKENRRLSCWKPLV
jgi:D-alanine-D-alanine ligase